MPGRPMSTAVAPIQACGRPGRISLTAPARAIVDSPRAASDSSRAIVIDELPNPSASPARSTVPAAAGKRGGWWAAVWYCTGGTRPKGAVPSGSSIAGRCPPATSQP